MAGATIRRVLVLHAFWSSGSTLRLWAEESQPPPRRRRPSDVHPFAARHPRLESLLTGGRRVDATLLLPTRAGAPVPSPSLPVEVSRRGRPTIAPWRVPALELLPLAAVGTLIELSANARADPSVRWLARACELALGMLSHGRVLPALVRDEARWTPIPAPDDSSRLCELAASMPPSCRAEVCGDAADGRSPSEVLSDLVASVADAIARDAFAPPARRGRAPTGGPAHAFLAALGSSDARVEAPALAAPLDAWRSSAVRAAGPVRTCFRLVAPDDPGGPGVLSDASGAEWRVEILLQSSADPSLLVGATEVWRAGRALALLDQSVADPQERLLEDLGRATRLWPDLEPALDEARPVAVSCDASSAHRFLRENAPLLEQAGFGVILPAWWGRASARLGLRMRATTRKDASESSGLLGTESLARFHYEVALGDQTLSARDLRSLARLKAPLVRVRGQWVELGSADVERALALLEQQRTQGDFAATAADVLRIGLGLEPSPDGLPVTAVEADGWLGELLGSQAERTLAPARAPSTFEGTLRPYQERGLGWLGFLDALGLGACLADDMGLGKTVQLLALLLAERSPKARKRLAPTLLVCPMSLVGNWQREAGRFAPSLRVHVHHGVTRAGGKAFATAARRADLVLTTYALTARDTDLLATVKWGRVVLDEAQNVKNASSRQAQAVRSLPAARRIALTGTPVENRLAELWSIMEFLNPGLLGPRSSFRERFAIPIERYRDDEAAATLRRVTQPFMLRRLKTDRTIVADLPDKIEMNVFCNLTREQATLYQAVVDDMLAKIDDADDIKRKGLVLATMTKLKQVCNHPAHFLKDGSRLDGRSGKLERLTSTIEEVAAEGERALVFTQYAEMGALLRSHLRESLGDDVGFLHGGVPKRKRDEMVAGFQDGRCGQVLILSLKAGGVGLNLTAATHVVHFDRWWNPAVEDQASDRAFRIGQTRNVQVRKLVCVGTLEERIDELIASKRDLAERIVGTGESWLTELSTSQIRELVALGADAVAEG